MMTASLRLLCACLAAATAVTAAPDPFDAAIRELGTNAVSIHDRYHVNPYDYIDRLLALRVRIEQALSLHQPALSADLARQAAIEAQLDRALLATAPPRLRPGVTERIVPTPSGGDAVGVFLPTAPQANGRYALVVALHGAGETEADVLSRAVIIGAAERSHAIVLAPWVNGDDLYGPASDREVLDQIDAIDRAYPIDPRRVYLLGISMGGAAALHLAVTHADRFTAVMTIVGDLDGHDLKDVKLALADKRVYLVMGGRDPIMGPRANAYTTNALARACVPFSAYVAPEARHDLYGVATQVTRAWNDMFAGIIRNGSSNECSGSPLGSR